MLRHLRAVHQIQTPQRASARRSCLQCIRRKLKCDRTQPCQRCVNSRTHCEYQNDSTTLTYVSPNSMESPDGALNVIKDAAEHTTQRHVVLEADQGRITPGQEGTLSLNDDNIQSTPEPFEESHTSVSDNGNPATFYADPVPFTGMSAQCGINGTLFTSPTEDLPLSLSLGYSGLDWLDFQLQDAIIPDEASTGIDFADPSFMQVPTPHSRQDDDKNAETRIRGIASADDIYTLNRMNGIAQPAHQQWPFDHNGETFPRSYQLPPLRDILQKTSMPTRGGNADILEEVANLLSSHYVPALDDSTYDCTKLSALHLLQQTINRFFIEFHPILPLVHVPTWSLFTCPTVLLTAMACIGAMLMEDSETLDKTMAFSEICTRMLFFQVSSPHIHFICEIVCPRRTIINIFLLGLVR